MDLEKLTLKERIDKLGYTSYDTFLKMNQLIADLLEESRLLSDEGDIQDLERHIYLAATNLGITLLSIIDKYERNGIKIRNDDVFSVGELKKAFPKNIIKAFKIGLSSEGLGKAVLNGTSELVAAIETELTNMPEYDPKYKSEVLEESIKEGLESVKKYAGLCQRFGDILVGLGKEKEGDMVKSGMARLTETEELLKKIKDEKFSQIFKTVIDLNAGIYNLPFDGDEFTFLGRTGDDVTWAMFLANEIREAEGYITNARLTKRKKFVNTVGDGLIYLESDGEELNEKVKTNGLANTIAERIMGVDSLKYFLAKTKAPFNDLDYQLTSLGIPFELARGVSDSLSINALGRGQTKLNKIKEKDYYKILARTESQIGKGKSIDVYAEAMKMLVENVTGKKLQDIVLSYFAKDIAHISSGISNWVNITELTKNGKIKTVKEYSSNKDVENLAGSVQKEFPDQKYDIYLSENTGVCFLFDLLVSYSPKSDFIPLVEVQNNFNDLVEADELAGLFCKTSIMTHELTHVSQVDSRLAWREMAAYLTDFVAGDALKGHKHGKLDYETMFHRSSFRKRIKKRFTSLDELVRLVDESVGQALGLGEFAENCRKKGSEDALAERGVVMRDDGTFNPKYFLELEWEDSKVSKLVKRVRKALEEKDIKELSKLKRKTKEYYEELSTIMETMAEAFSFIATKNFIEHHPQNLSDKEKDYYTDFLEAKIIGRGVRNQAVSDIIVKYKKRPKRMEDELNKKGFTYKRVLGKYQDQKPVEKRLLSLGYDPSNPFEAYDDMKGLKKRVKERNEVAEKKLKRRFVKLGYKNIEEVSGDIEKLQKRIAKYNKDSKEKIYEEDILKTKWELKDLLYPTNNSEAVISLRYSENVPMFLRIIDKYGPYRAHDLMLNAESLKELEKLVD